VKWKVGDIFINVDDSDKRYMRCVIGKIIKNRHNRTYDYVTLADTYGPGAKNNLSFFQPESDFEKYNFLISEAPPGTKRRFIKICFIGVKA